MIEFLNEEEFNKKVSEYINEDSKKRFLERKGVILWLGKNFDIFKLFINKKTYYFIADYKNKKIYTTLDIKKIITELKFLIKKTKNFEECLFTIYSKVLDAYFAKLGRLSRIILNERKKLLTGEGELNITLIEHILDSLDDIEDRILILRYIYRNTLKDKRLISLLAEESFNVMDTLKELREKVKFLLDLQNNIQQAAMNYRIERLTILSTIFLPATLIASIYGMNFTNVLPRWTHPYGFVIALSTILISSFLTYIIIMKKLTQTKKL